MNKKLNWETLAESKPINNMQVDLLQGFSVMSEAAEGPGRLTCGL